MCLDVYRSVDLSVYLPAAYLPLCLSLYPSIHPCACLSTFMCLGCLVQWRPRAFVSWVEVVRYVCILEAETQAGSSPRNRTGFQKRAWPRRAFLLTSTIGACILRLGFRCMLYCNYNQEPQNSVGIDNPYISCRWRCILLDPSAFWSWRGGVRVLQRFLLKCGCPKLN